MDINETFISRGRDNKKPFRLITTLKRSASDRSHEDWLAVFTVDEIGLLIGVRLENGKYPTLRPFLKQT
jgi:hypothetical protein